jgi:hypothetical protein
MYGPQSPSPCCNDPTSAEIQGDWIADTIDYMEKNKLNRIEAKADAEIDYKNLVDMVSNFTLLPIAERLVMVLRFPRMRYLQVLVPLLSWYMGEYIPGKLREFRSQGDYRSRIRDCEGVLDRFDMAESRPVGTPIDPHVKLQSQADDEHSCKATYLRAIGSLMSFDIDNLDLAFAVGYLGRFSSDPRITHWVAVKRVFRYLTGTIGKS